MNNLLKILQDGSKKLSKSHRLIAEYVVQNYDKAAFMTASQLGHAVGVSESTVVRFAIEMNFAGYPEFSKHLQEIARTKLTSVQRMEVSNTRIGDSDILANVISSDINKLKVTLENIDRKDFDSAINTIINAENIYILGVRSSFPLASFLSYYLSLIFKKVRLVSATSGGEMLEQIMHADKNDVVIGISFPRYSTRIIRSLEYAKSRGSKIISITDSTQSPIAHISDYKLLAKSDMASFADSLVAPLSIINSLIVSIGMKKNENISDVLTELEAIWDSDNVYDKEP